MPRGRRVALAALLAGGLALALWATSAPAAAHADFLASTPAPYDIWNVAPAYVSVTVSEAVQPGSPTITVTNGTNHRVDTGPTQLSPTDPATFAVHLLSGIGPSVYTVTWSVVSADDGHFTAGTFYFMIAYRNGTLPGAFPRTGAVSQSQPISPIDVSLDAANFIGFAIAFGSTLVAALLWSPMAFAGAAEGRAPPAEGFRALLSFARLGAWIFAAAAAGLWAENLILSPPSGLGGVVGSTFLLSTLTQAAIGIAMALLLTHLLRRGRAGGAWSERAWELLPTLFLGFLAILAEAAASHGAATQAWWPLGPVADAVHLYGAALWAGGLLALLRTRRWLRAPTPADFSEGLLRAFSRLALLGVGLLVAAGAGLALFLVGTVGGLLGSSYGWVILAKTALLVPMVLLGAWNRRSLRREPEAPPTPEGVERLTRTVRFEAMLGVAILVLAGLLATMNPAAAPGPQNATFTLDATAGGLYAIFQVNPWPNGPGSYIFQLVLYYAGNGTPYYPGANATLSFLLEGGNGTWVTLALEGPHGNHYFVESSVLDATGTWDLRATVRGPQGTPVEFGFAVRLPS
ncbi:MAG TPA: CopD family protein [Thermoplasmata archaeon]|nr:CopD family protein [Thermoplasmata archaeon]